MDFSLNNYYLMFKKDKETLILITLTDMNIDEVKISDINMK